MNSAQRLLRLVFVVFLAASYAGAQCLLPRPPLSRQPNMFSPQQELLLGDILAEREVLRSMRIIEDATLSAEMERVGERLVRASGQPLSVRYYVSDAPFANAFSLPGRIFVTRKLIAFLRDEDELAGLLAHELGHQLAHQSAIVLTAQLRNVLKVQSVTTRDDIFNKYQELLDNWTRKREAFERATAVMDQETADALGLDALVRAGYRPEAMAEMFDRFAGVGGKTGNWFTELFGLNTPEQKRLREMVRAAKTAPAACIQSATPMVADFSGWQKRVAEFTGSGRTESVNAVLFKKKLDPPLRDDLHTVRFSPDGAYILAQDTGGIHVLSRAPFSFLFRIDAPGAQAAQFSPDSRSIVFRSSSSRVEIWSVQQQSRTAMHDMVVRRDCDSSSVSPDGKYLACVDADLNSLRIDMFGGILRFFLQVKIVLLDVATGDQKFEKSVTVQPAGLLDTVLVASGLRPGFAEMQFTQDGHYLAVASTDSPQVIELTTLKTISLSGELRRALATRFAFVGNDRLAGLDVGEPHKSRLVKFPSGELIGNIAVGDQGIAAATRGDYLLLRPIKDHALGVYNIQTGKIFMATEMPTLDVYGEIYARETGAGNIGLFNLTDGRAIAQLELPIGLLGPVQAFDVSPDHNRLAVSERHRAAVWDLEPQRGIALLPAFDSAALDGDMLFAGREGRTGSAMQVDMRPPGKITPLNGDAAHAVSSTYIGGYELRRTRIPAPPQPTKTLKIEIVDRQTNAVAWQREVAADAPPVIRLDAASRTLALIWNPVWRSTHDALNKLPHAKAAGSAAFDDKNRFVELFDLATGKLRSAVVIETKGAFIPTQWEISRDWIVAGDNLGRALMFAADGKNNPRAHVFARWFMPSTSGLLAAENQPGHLEIYEMTNGAKKNEFVLPAGIAAARFSPDGKRLFVLGRDQTAYSFDVTARGSAAGE